MRRVCGVLFVVVALVAAACGNDDDASTSSGDATATSAPSGEEAAGPSAEELAFGAPAEFGEWTLTVLSVVNAEEAGVLSEDSPSPADGSVFLAVEMEVTFDGTEADALDPFLVEVVGSQAYESFTNECVLDFEVIEHTFDFTPGQTGKITQCFEVAESDLGDLHYTVDSVDDPLDTPLVVFAGPIT